MLAEGKQHGATQEYRVKSSSDCFCRYAQPIHDTKTHCPLPTQIKTYKSCQHSPVYLSSEKLQHSCCLWLAGCSGVKFVLANLTISRVFSEVWQYPWAVSSDDVVLHGMHCNPYCCNRVLPIPALPASKGRPETACLHTATYFSKRVGHIDSHQPILMRPICTEKWINDAKQLLSTCICATETTFSSRE